MKWIKYMIQRFWISIFWASVRHIHWSRRTVVGARTKVEFTTERIQTTLVIWDLTNPKYAVAYSREELINMLSVIRHCEKEMGWKVPELDI